MTISAANPAEESIMVGQMGIRYLIDGAASGGLGVFELSVPPNAMVPPPHSHTHNEECVMFWKAHSDIRWTAPNTI